MEICGWCLSFLVVLTLQTNINSHGQKGTNSSSQDRNIMVTLDDNSTAKVFRYAVSVKNDSFSNTNLETKTSDGTTSEDQSTEPSNEKENSLTRKSALTQNEMNTRSVFESLVSGRNVTTGRQLMWYLSVNYTDFPFVDSPAVLNQTFMVTDTPDVSRDLGDGFSLTQETTELSIEPTASTEQTELRNSTYQITVGENCTQHTFRPGQDFPIAECSLTSLFQSNLSTVNVSLFEPLMLSFADMELCSDDKQDLLNPKYILNGSITISSDDQLLQDRIKKRKGTNFKACVRLQSPPFTFLQLRVENIEEWMKSSAKVSVQIDKRHVSLKALAKGKVAQSADNDVKLTITGLSKVFQHSPNPVTITLALQAKPECVRNQMDVKCPTKNYLGYIQTQNWDGERRYDPEVDTCVTITPPEKLTVMISFVALDVEIHSLCKFDFVEIYLSPSCTGTSVAKICNDAEAFPEVHVTDVLSIRFKSDYSIEKTGFRLLYSFHPLSDPPTQLRSGKWMCSGPRGPVLVQHFICSSVTYCENSEDRVLAGCPPSDLCGNISFMIEDRCYRYVKSTRKITWLDAWQTCKANKGYLVSLNTEEEWDKVVSFWNNDQTGAKYMMVGLRQITNTHSKLALYSSVWRWSDSTVAYYLNASFSSGSSPPYCGMLQKKKEHIIFRFCYSPSKANFLCELNTQSDQDLKSDENQKIVLPEPSRHAIGMPHLSVCPSKHLVHGFLQCNRLAYCYEREDDDVKKCLRDKPLLAETMFTCKNEKQRVHYTLVCDHRKDCSDRSDEDLCDFPPCGSEQFPCGRIKQCISGAFRCDGIRHCIDGSDESTCRRSKKMSGSNTMLPPALVHFTGRGGITFTPLNASQDGPVCPETHFQCPGNGYCLPVYVRCNEVFDCPGKEDEADYGVYTCPGFYRCHGSQICVHEHHLCDGIFQCPRHDDELMCNVTCPSVCSCLGFAFVCSGNFLADLHPEMRYLNADNTGMTLQDVTQNKFLIYLSLRHCNIREIGIINLSNIQSLYLSYNRLTSFRGIELKEMKYLRFLSLAFNPLLSLNSINYVSVEFSRLSFLDMSGTNTHEITNTSFLPFLNLQHLNLSRSALRKVGEPGFSTLRRLLVLDFSQCPVREFYADMFRNLSDLQTIYASKFQMCCPTILPEDFDSDNCHAPSDEVSSCAALLRADVFRVFLVIYAFLALIGNSVSFLYRVFGKGVTTKLGFDVFVTHLCVSDFLMGVYLAIVGIADRIYYGTYQWNDRQWKQSVACQTAGFLSLLSSEVSAFLICFITLERFLLIHFPHKNLRFTLNSARVACLIGWVVGVLLAAIPLLPFSPLWDFYSQTGICIPLPVTRKVFPGSEYSFYVMIIFNFILFLFIAVGQFLIYWSIRSQMRSIGSSSKKGKEMAIARRLLAVAMSDFLCWFPIGVLGLLARSGTPISGNVNVALAIFVLPVNSALNPFLYTFHMVVERRRIARMQRGQKVRDDLISTNCPTCVRREQLVSPEVPSISTAVQPVQTIIIHDGYTAEEARKLIEGFLQEVLMTPEQLQLHVTKMIRERSSETITVDK